MTAPGVYRAKVIAPFAGGVATVVVPQLFGETHVYVTSFASVQPPLTTVMGWVMFEGGDEGNPVWVGTDANPLAADEGAAAVAPLGSYLNPWITEDQTPPPWAPGDYWLRPVL
jgi:hypothetical protein